jgi:hypothetical protein
MRPAEWQTMNQRALCTAMDELRAYIRKPGTEGPTGEYAPTNTRESALERVCATFGLSTFERATLIMCAGVELRGDFAARCAEATGSSGPTFSFALAVLPGAHWSALAPGAALRKWRLIELGQAGTLAAAPLRIDERILHYLVGVPGSDERLAGLFEPVQAVDTLVPSHQRVADEIVEIWQASGGQRPVPAIQLCGDGVDDKRTVAAAAARKVGLQPWVLAADTIPAGATDADALARLWQREAALTGCALLVDCSLIEGGDGSRMANATRFVERCRGATLIGAAERRSWGSRTTVALEVTKPPPAEQRAAWHDALGPGAVALNGGLDPIIAQFTLSVQSIRSAALHATKSLHVPGAHAPSALWDACRAQARPRLDDVAQRIDAVASWDDLILPSAERAILREMASHVRCRATVYDRWGFAGQGSRGLGTSALFAGASGTGKTMAAEVLANELRLDLYRIDLSSVVSKYIGETEKNLRRVFDAAEAGSCILLFDEADALFGKRSEVKDSHDRYANIEISYLLQRMESYRGLAILTTNMRAALDTAFMRRLRFVVEFPFPDPAHRAEIWRRVFPRATPVDGLDVARLAQLSVAGGNIRSIALNAAFLAADAGEPIRMGHVLHAAHREYAKLERPLTDAETTGWTTDAK